MIPRTESIFNIGEDKDTTHDQKETDKSCCSSGLYIRGAPGSHVGLRILIDNHHGQASNVVIKSTLKLRRSSGSLPELSFLKSCFTCKKELSLEKDVYMYRGDKGFCSVECRYQEILLDEKREFETKMRERLRVYYHHHQTTNKAREYDRRKRRISIGA